MAIKKNSQDVIKYLQKDIPQGKKTVFLSGVFNIIHPGHTRLFRYAAEHGDYVVVGILSDSIQKEAIIGEEDRMHALDAMSWIDHVFILDDKPEDFIAEFQPDIVVKGREFEKTDNPEKQAVDQYGGRLLFSSGEVKLSSLDLIKREIKEISSNVIEHDNAFLKRHELIQHDLEKALDDFAKLDIIVVGDTIVDEYVACDAVGLSQEDPTVVVRPSVRTVFVGGAGIVAGHARGMGANVSFHTVLGDDEFTQTAKDQLKDYDLDLYPIIDDTRPTTHKKRYRANGKTLLRVNEYSQQPISMEIQNKLYDQIAEKLKDADALIFSDFNYGILPQDLLERISAKAKELGVMMAADSQSSSQVGDIARFKGMSLITPTEHEARIATRDIESGLDKLARKLAKTSEAAYVLLTLAAEGVLIKTNHYDQKGRWLIDQLSALNKNPKDPAGAGDAMMVVTALTLAGGNSIWQAVYLGSMAAACQVGRVGNIPLTTDELKREIKDSAWG